MKEEARRGKLELVAAILKTCRDHGPIGVTQIIYKANLSTGQYQKYVPTLVEVNLLTVYLYRDRKTYELTPGGIEWLRRFESIAWVLSARESLLNGSEWPIPR